MSYMQFRQKCEGCGFEWNAAFGIVGVTQIAAPPTECPKCHSKRIKTDKRREAARLPTKQEVKDWGIPRDAAERAAFWWLVEHHGEVGHSVMQSLAETMRQYAESRLVRLVSSEAPPPIQKDNP